MTTVKQPEALMALIEAYAEARHKHGAPEYNARAAAARTAVLHALTTHAGADGWVKVSERLPEPGTAVLLDIGEPTPLRAQWCPAKTLPCSTDDSGEYDEATDTYWCIEGWYEWNREEEIHWFVSKPALNWRPLPEAPNA